MNRTGSCSGKHLALACLLRKLGHSEVEILTFHCDFAAAVGLAEGSDRPPHAGLLSYLGGASGGAVHDFHHAVRCGGEVLDATWPDALAPHGFRVNSSWTAGSGDTLLAVPDDAVYQAFGAVDAGQLSDLKATLVVRCMHTTPLSLLSLGRILSEPNKRYDFDGGAGHTTARGGGEACGLFQRVADVAWRATKGMRGRDEDASKRRPGLPL